jgi:hypothetical protein
MAALIEVPSGLEGVVALFTPLFSCAREAAGPLTSSSRSARAD